MLHNATAAVPVDGGNSTVVTPLSGDDLCATNGDGLTTTYAGNWTLFYNESRPNSLPAFLALLDGAGLLGDASAFGVSAALFSEAGGDAADDVSYAQIGVALTLTYLVGLAMMPLGVSYTWDVVKDRADGRQQQLAVLGVRPVAVWGSALVVDFARWCLPMTAIVAVIAIDRNAMLLSHGAGPALISVLYLSGLHTVLAAYALGTVIDAPEFVSTTLASINTLLVMVVYSVVWTVLVSTVGFSEQHFLVASLLLVVFGAALPPLLVMSAFSVVVQLSAYGTAYPDSPVDYFAWSVACPHNSSEQQRCFGVLPLLASSALGIAASAAYLLLLRGPGDDGQQPLGGVRWGTVHGKGGGGGGRGSASSDEGAAAVAATASPLLGQLDEDGGDGGGGDSGGQQNEDEDEDVAAERRRVLAAAAEVKSFFCAAGRGEGPCGSPCSPLMGGELNQHQRHEGENVVLIQRLRKEFSESEKSKTTTTTTTTTKKNKGATKVAVDDVYFGISRGECFGLLGHNGAGKTSLIGMLTGVLAPTSGDALVNGFSVAHEMEQVLASTG